MTVRQGQVWEHCSDEFRIRITDTRAAVQTESYYLPVWLEIEAVESVDPLQSYGEIRTNGSEYQISRDELLTSFSRLEE